MSGYHPRNKSLVPRGTAGEEHAAARITRLQPKAHTRQALRKVIRNYPGGMESLA